ncbi:DUF3826 domain-containing protein [Aridibaculum aurantiacum]|uniref:DUF3826 domain-containing protein n=1 Tax=Aridibaculum aurantiacum TaxID=2810307 RepID=UPI001A975992|nr:DUF3826 domain-containing protein [Aridibaculum aurantiacum]
MPVKIMIAVLLFISFAAVAQEKQTLSPSEQEAAYTKVVTERAQKIVVTLGINDSQKALRVRDLIANQYKNLNAIHDERNGQVKQLKSSGAGKEQIDAMVKAAEEKANVSLGKLHTTYLSALSNELTSQQVEQVKDGMTYNVVNITYKGYQDMIPTLTEVQKKKIYDWLVEARELAMDAESSEKKHGWFGKYKGRINNYLSAEGYDLRKEGEEWQKRIKAKANQ